MLHNYISPYICKLYTIIRVLLGITPIQWIALHWCFQVGLPTQILSRPWTTMPTRERSLQGQGSSGVWAIEGRGLWRFGQSHVSSCHFLRRFFCPLFFQVLTSSKTWTMYSPGFFHILPYFAIFCHMLLFSIFLQSLYPTIISYYILLYTNRPSYDFRCISNKTYVLLGSFLLGLPFGSKRHASPRSKDGIILWTVKMGDMGGPLSLKLRLWGKKTTLWLWLT